VMVVVVMTRKVLYLLGCIAKVFVVIVVVCMIYFYSSTEPYFCNSTTGFYLYQNHSCRLLYFLE
jgi:uncharacterized protein YpmB